MGENSKAIWEKHYAILREYYASRGKLEEIKNTNNWFNIQINKIMQSPQKMCQIWQQDMLLDMIRMRYRITEVIGVDDAEKIMKDILATERLYMSRKQRQLFIIMHFNIIFENGWYYGSRNLSKLDAEVMKKYNALHEEKMEIYRTYDDILRHLIRGERLTDIKRTDKQLYDNYKKLKTKWSGMTTVDRKQLQSKKKQIDVRNRKLKEKNQKAEHIQNKKMKMILKKVYRYYQTTQIPLYEKDKALYIQYRKIRERINNKDIDVQEDVEALNKKIESLRNNQKKT